MPNSDKIDSKDFLKNMSDEQRQQWARAIVQRMMLAWQVDEYKALAALLDLHPQTPSNWIQKKAVPWTAIYTCHKATGKSLDWLFNGEETTVEISSQKRKSFEKSAVELLTYSAKMNMVAKIKEDGFTSVAEGMATCFIEVLEAGNKK